MDEMDQADQELRLAIGRSWPFTKRDGKLDLLVPPPAETGPNKLTVGKIFGGMLILENWKLTRFGTTLSTTHKSIPVNWTILKKGSTPACSFTLCSHLSSIMLKCSLSPIQCK
jgi:hypothetical protein